jgi:predicted nucleic acid-binding protein
MPYAGQVCFDMNVLLETVLNRVHKQIADKLLHAHANDAAISALTAHLIVHFGRNELSIEVLEGFLSDFTILPLENDDFAWAFGNRRSADYDDALQLAVAVRRRCEVFYTFDEGLFKLYRTLPQIRVRLLGKASR